MNFEKPNLGDTDSSDPKKEETIKEEVIPAPEEHNPEQEQIQKLENFELSGDFEEDARRFLELTDRTLYFSKIDSGDISLPKLLSDIKRFQQESLNPDSDLHHDVKEDDPRYKTKQIFFRDIPKLEINLIQNILDEAGEAESDNAINENLQNNLDELETSVEEVTMRLLALEQRIDSIYAIISDKAAQLAEFAPDFSMSVISNNYDRYKQSILDRYMQYEKLQSLIMMRGAEALESGVGQEYINGLMEEMLQAMRDGTDKEEEVVGALESLVDEIPDSMYSLQTEEDVEQLRDRLKQIEDLLGKEF